MFKPGRKEDKIREQTSHVFTRRGSDCIKLGVSRKLMHLTYSFFSLFGGYVLWCYLFVEVAVF